MKTNNKVNMHRNSNELTSSSNGTNVLSSKESDPSKVNRLHVDCNDDQSEDEQSELDLYKSLLLKKVSSLNKSAEDVDVMNKPN